MSRIKDKLLNMLFYFLVLSIVAFILGFASLGGYLFGSVQTAKEYDFIFKSFKDNVEARQVFYFCGYRVVPKGNGVTINLSAQERADLSEAKEAALRTMINEDFSKRDVDFRHKILQNRLVLK